MSQHCRHCGEDCRAGKIGYTITREHYSEDEDATWDRGCCPACAEAERITLEILRHAEHTAATGEEITARTAYGRCVAISNSHNLLPDGAYFT